MNKEHIVLKLAGVAAILTSITTFLLWLLPRLYESPASFEESLGLAQNTFYMSRQWVNFFHIPLALLAYFGLAFKLRKREGPVALLGFVWFLIWGIVEMMGVAGIIFAVNRNWRNGYAEASETIQETLRNNIDFYFALWDSMFFVLLIAFLLGTVFYGWVTWKGKGLEKLLSYLFWLAAPLTILIILSGYFGFEYGTAMVGFIYPILQPVSRFLLGVFLIKNDNTVTKEY